MCEYLVYLVPIAVSSLVLFFIHALVVYHNPVYWRVHNYLFWRYVECGNSEEKFNLVMRWYLLSPLVWLALALSLFFVGTMLYGTGFCPS